MSYLAQNHLHQQHRPNHPPYYQQSQEHNYDDVSYFDDASAISGMSYSQKGGVGGGPGGGYSGGGGGDYYRGGTGSVSGSVSGKGLDYSDRTPNSKVSSSYYTTRGSGGGSGSVSGSVYSEQMYDYEYGMDGSSHRDNYASNSSYSGGGGTNNYISRGSDGMSQVSTSSSSRVNRGGNVDNASNQYFNDTASYCGSTTTTHTATTNATTVADGGWGRCPYQIEFTVQNSGKQVSGTKRIIHFRFGFADPTALAAGKIGTDCRGEEHDVVITWSITGGKRSICVDGREIQYSAGKRNNAARRADILEAAWGMPGKLGGDHVCQVICYAYKPAVGSPEKRDKNWRQYNMTINGRPFFELPQIFDLGLKGLRARSQQVVATPPATVASHGGTYETTSFANVSSVDQRELKHNIQAQIEAQRKLMNARKKSTTNDNNSVQNRSRDDRSVMSARTYGSNSTTSDLIDLGGGMSVMSGMSGMSISSSSGHGSKAGTNRTAGMLRRPSSNDGSTFAPQVHSMAPSELDEAKMRRNAPVQQQPQQQQQHRQDQRQQVMGYNQLPQYSGQGYQGQQQQQPQQSQYSTSSQPQQRAYQNFNPSQPKQLPPSSLQSQQTQQTQQAQQLAVFVPQQPPTYEEITRDIIGAYDGSPNSNPTFTRRNSTESNARTASTPSTAAYSGANPRLTRRNSTESTPSMPSTLNPANQNTLVPTTPQISQLVGKTQSSLNSSQASTQASGQKAISSVEQGINKWGYF